MGKHKSQKTVRSINKDKSGVELSQMHDSIMPASEEMKTLESLCPGITDRYMTMAEKDQQHYLDNDMKVFDKIIFSTNTGRVIGGLIFLTINGLAAYMVSQGHSGEAVATVISELIVGLVAYIGNKSPVNKRINS